MEIQTAGTVGTRFLCIDAHVCTEKIDYKTGTLFLYSKSIGVFNVGIGFFSIRAAEKSRFGLIETTQSITIACPPSHCGHANLPEVLGCGHAKRRRARK